MPRPQHHSTYQGVPKTLDSRLKNLAVQPKPTKTQWDPHGPPQSLTQLKAKRIQLQLDDQMRRFAVIKSGG